MGKRIKDQYADTGGFTAHVFAVTSILGHRFIPRIRDLPSKRLYVFDTGCMPPNLNGLVGSRIREGLIASNWPDILRIAAIMTVGTIAPSQILDNPVLAAAWSAMLARSVQAARLRSEIRSMLRVAERLDAWLGEGNALPGKGRWQEVASELGVTREALYRELSRRRARNRRASSSSGA
jgi:hypothetical protein